MGVVTICMSINDMKGALILMGTFFRLSSLKSMEEIELPKNIISNNNPLDTVFSNCFANENYEGMKNSAVFAPLNKDVDRIE